MGTARERHEIAERVAMTQKNRLKRKNEQCNWHPVRGKARRHFLEELRQARLAAQADAEAFDQIIFVLERLGSFRLGEVADLNDYKPPLMDLLADSPLGDDLGPSQSAWHSEKCALFWFIRNARNDALHQGARARYLTEHTIEFALLLEDALMNGDEPMTYLRDIMVRSPVVAEKWQPVSLLRKTMLANSFSNLPIKWRGEWKTVSDASVAAFLRKDCPSGGERKRRLALPLADAEAQGLKLDDVDRKADKTRLSDIGRSL